jgi:protein-glutamine gamma-glutamyltransferase
MIDDEALFVRLLHASAYAVACAVFAAPLGPASAMVAAGAGGLLGSLAGSRLGESRLRSPVLALALPLGVALAAISEGIFRGSYLVARALGPESSLATADVLTFFFVSAGLVFTLRSLGRRHRTVGVLEISIVGLAVSELFAVHRGGAINRPFELADRVLSLGGDPADVLLGVGVAGAVIVAVILLRTTRLRRGLFHLLAALLLLGVVGSLFPIFEVPIPEVASTGVGLRNESKPARGDQGSDQEELDFENSGRRDDDRPPVAVVTFHNDYSPPGGVYFFRQASLSQWNGTRLVHASGDVDRDIADGFPHPELTVTPPPSAQGRSQILTSVGLLAEHYRPFGLESPIRFESAVNPDPRRFRRTYRVVSQALEASDIELLGANAGEPSWTEAKRRHYLERPNDPRYRELAERILVEMLPEDLRGEPVAQVRAITAWLEREGTYSLNVAAPPPTAEPTAAFLFGDLVGYCVHFSHAAALLFRALELPARVATGYAIPEQARRGGSALLLTDAFSHAWAEVYISGVGWLVADVQPLNSLDPPPPLPDADLTRLLGELRRGESRDALATDESETRLPSLRDLFEQLWKALALVVLVALVVLYAGKAWRRAPGSRSPTRVYRARLDALAELGYRRSPGETPEAFARRLEAAIPSLTPLTEAHLASAFGGRPRLGSEEVRALNRRVRAEVSRDKHPLRRLVAMIDPFSWLSSR